MAPVLAPRIRRKSSKNGEWGVNRQQAAGRGISQREVPTPFVSGLTVGCGAA
jgi:hypothetical protein